MTAAQAAIAAQPQAACPDPSQHRDVYGSPLPGAITAQPQAAPGADAEFTAWAEARGVDPIGMDYAEYGADALRDAFAAGMQAAAQPQPAAGLTPVEAVRLAVAEEWQPRVDALREELAGAREQAQRYRELLDSREPLTVKPADDVKAAPELAAAMRETRDLRERLMAVIAKWIKDAAKDEAKSSRQPNIVRDTRAQVALDHAEDLRKALEIE